MGGKNIANIANHCKILQILFLRRNFAACIDWHFREVLRVREGRGGGVPSQTADKLNSLVAVSLHSYLTNGRAVHPKWQPRLVGRCLFVILTPFCKIPPRCNFKILRPTDLLLLWPISEMPQHTLDVSKMLRSFL